MRFKFILVAILALCVSNLSAQQYKEDYVIKKNSIPSGQKVEMIYGVMTGIVVPQLSDKSKFIDFSNTVGYNIGMMWGIDLGGLEIVPEIWYQHDKTDFSVDLSGVDGDLISNSIELPVIIGVELGPVRFNFGPSFALMSSSKICVDAEEDRDFNGYKSTAGYLLGVSTTLWQHFVIDMRYTGRFVTSSTVWDDGYDISDESEYRYYSFGFNVGYRF